jgi:transposase
VGGDRGRSAKLGVGTAETLRSWVRQAEVDAEIKRLKGEVAELRRANEILKAASVYVGDRCQVPVWSSR